MATARCTSDDAYLAGMERLVEVVQELSMARSLERIMTIVRSAAREIVGADGATFVLREGNQCFYADEDAIAPLWKGLRFPMEACISGWAMHHRQATRIGDIYTDARIPLDAYEPTFVRSLVMVPIRRMDPIGAIGTYWASTHAAPDYQVKLLQSLADSTSIALENVSILRDLDRRIQERTSELEAANLELNAFNSAVSHDLRNPINSILGYSTLILAREGDELPHFAKNGLETITNASRRMTRLIEDLLRLSSVAHGELKLEAVELSVLAREILGDLQRAEPERQVELQVEEGLVVTADAGLLRIALTNLLGNAWKFTARSPRPVIRLGSREGGVFVQDNGVGFAMDQADRLFRSFTRLDSARDFQGTGIGLVTVRRILERHGGRIWAEGTAGQGATFYLSFPPRRINPQEPHPCPLPTS